MTKEEGFCKMNPSMKMQRNEYEEHCILQKRKKVSIMCKPLKDIQNMTAQQLLEHSGQVNNVPVDLKQMLETLKISSLSFDFSDMEKAINDSCKTNDDGAKGVSRILGALVTNHDNAVIFYSDKDTPESHRHRFTIAHELAHCCLSHYPVSESTVHLNLRQEGEPVDEEELAANIFAGELLIPKENLYSVIDSLIIPSLQTLADIFAVSVNVMRARLDYLNVKKSISGYNY